jgi:protein translocase SecG subunit
MNAFLSFLAPLLPYLQIGTALLIIALVLLQERSSGISLLANESSYYQTRRGLERIVFISTIVLSGLFVVLALLSLVLK